MHNKKRNAIGISGIPGMLYSFEILDDDTSLAPAGASIDYIDFQKMSRWAMNYLLKSPRPELNYEPIFSCCPIGCPPVPSGRDPIVDGDTDSRMDWEFYYMREISGAVEGRNIESAFHRRIRGYLGKNDICWTEPGCYLSPNMKPDEKIGNVWTTTKLLKSLALSYERTGDPEDKHLARRVFEGLRSLASRSCKYAWYPAGFGPVDANLNPISLTWEHTAPCPAVESLVCYWKTCVDEEALALAIACAESIVDGYPELNLTSINPDGSFSGHTHTTLHAMWGIAHLGVETRNPRYMEFIRRIYQFMEGHGTGTGWMHEGTAPDPVGSDNCSETCTTSDVMSIVACLAQSAEFMGNEYAAYWDHLERYFRNHIVPCQFFVTPHFEAFYRERHKAMPIEMVNAGIESLRKMEGGILAGVGVNDFFNDYPGDQRTSFIMVGCCAPEGMRAIYTTWSNIVRTETVKSRKLVHINMPLPVDTDECEVVSFLPDKGQITVKAHKPADYRLRPPAWAPSSKVRAWMNGSEIDPVWDGVYIAFDSINADDTLSITWPLAEYRQHAAIFADPEMTADFQWKGSLAVAVNPPGKHFPMHTGKRIEIPIGPQLPE